MRSILIALGSVRKKRNSTLVVSPSLQELADMHEKIYIDALCKISPQHYYKEGAAREALEIANAGVKEYVLNAYHTAEKLENLLRHTSAAEKHP